MLNNAQAKSDAYTVLGLDVVWTAEFAANQWVVELPQDGFPLDELIPSTVVTGTYFDKLYGVPFTTNAQLLFSRTDLLEKAGWTSRRRPSRRSRRDRDAAGGRPGAARLRLPVLEVRGADGADLEPSRLRRQGGSSTTRVSRTPTRPRRSWACRQSATASTRDTSPRRR